MNQFYSILIIVLIWIISFVEPSGWAGLIHLNEKVNTLIVFTSIVLYLKTNTVRLPISGKLFSCIVVFLALIPFLISGKWEGASYLTSFLIVYITMQLKITAKVIKYSAWAIGTLGIFILSVYTFGKTLSGWNDNAISMVGLFSYLYFSIYLIYHRKDRSFWKWNIVTVVYLWLLFKTDCRSGMIFSILTVLCIYYANKTRLYLLNPRTKLFLLNFPIIISIVVLLIAASPFFDSLDTWSIAKYHKPIFNGREVLWDDAIQWLWDSNLMGTGKFMTNYHNSGLAALSVFGIIGYIIWIKFFSRILNVIQSSIGDNIVFGCTLAFLVIYVQQSFDLGFISPIPNLLPYMILGIGLGRIRLLLLNRAPIHG